MDYADFRTLVRRMRCENTELAREYGGEVLVSIVVLDKTERICYACNPHSINLTTGDVFAYLHVEGLDWNVKDALENNQAFDKEHSRKGKKAVLYRNPAAHMEDGENE